MVDFLLLNIFLLTQSGYFSHYKIIFILVIFYNALKVESHKKAATEDSKQYDETW